MRYPTNMVYSRYLEPNNKYYYFNDIRFKHNQWIIYHIQNMDNYHGLTGIRSCLGLNKSSCDAVLNDFWNLNHDQTSNPNA